MKLKAFQEEFTKLVLNPNDICTLSFRPEGKLNDNDAINVYRNDYEARMLEALGSNFEATWLMLGDEDFFEVGKKYIAYYPSTFKSLMHFGHQFPQFLNAENFDDSVVIMSQFESFFWKLFHVKEKDQVALTQDLITNGTFNLERIGVFHAPMRIDQIWIHRKDSTSSIEEIDLEEEIFLVLFKEYDQVKFKSISPKSFQFLTELKQLGSIKVCQTVPNESDWKEIFEVIQFS